MEKKASAEKVIESGQGVELTVAISPTALREDAIGVTPGDVAQRSVSAHSRWDQSEEFEP